MPGLWESHELCLCEEGSGVGRKGNRLAFQLEGLHRNQKGALPEPACSLPDVLYPGRGALTFVEVVD